MIKKINIKKVNEAVAGGDVAPCPIIFLSKLQYDPPAKLGTE